MIKNAAATNPVGSIIFSGQEVKKEIRVAMTRRGGDAMRLSNLLVLVTTFAAGTAVLAQMPADDLAELPTKREIL